MIRANLFCFGFGVLLLNGYCIAQETDDPQARASPPRRHADALGQSQRPLAVSVRRAGRKAWRRAGRSPARRVTTARSSCPFPGRASFREFTRSKVRPRSAGIAVTSRSPRIFPPGSRLAPLRGGRLAGRRLGERPEGRRSRRRIHAVRGRYHRCRRSRGRQRPGRSRVRPDRSRACRPASRLAGTRRARGSGRPSGSRPGPRPTSPTSAS